MYNDRYLQPWTEVVGEVMDIEEVIESLVITLSCGTLTYHRESIAAEILRDELEGNVGRRASILETNDVGDPIRVLVEN